MPRTCTICRHAERAEIDAALVTHSASYRALVARHGVSLGALARHADEHLPLHLVTAREAEDATASLNLMAELTRCVARVNLLFDACDRWLPDQYDIGPRAEDVLVTYWKADDPKRVRRKERLSNLIAKAQDVAEVVIEHGETRYADPRKLLLDTSARLGEHLTLLQRIIESADMLKRLEELEAATDTRGAHQWRA